MSFISIPAIIEIEVEEQVNGNDKRRITEALRNIIKDEAIGDSLASSLYEQGETEVDGVVIKFPEKTLTARSAEIPLFFTRNYEDNTVTASEWPDVIDIDSFLIGWGDGDVMSTVVTFRCANGSAAYRIIGIRDGGAFVAERLQ